MKNIIKVLFVFSVVFFVSGCDLGTEEVENFDVNFITNGGSEIASISVEDGRTFLEPTHPIKENYDFEGWYSDSLFNNTYDFTNPVIGDVNLYAKWVMSSYTVTFESNGGSTFSDAIVLINQELTGLISPIKSGSTFAGWYMDSEFTEEYDALNPIFVDYTLYAKWELNQYTVTFESNGGSNIDSVVVDYFSIIMAPINPTYNDRDFLGWYIDPEFNYEYNFLSNIDQNFTLYAKWEESVLNIYFAPPRDPSYTLEMINPIEELLQIELELLGYSFDEIKITISASDTEVGEALSSGDADVALMYYSTYAQYSQDGLIDVILAAARNGLSKTSFDPIDWNDGLPTYEDSNTLVSYYFSLIIAGPSPVGRILADKVNAGIALTWEDLEDVNFCHGGTTSNASYLYPNLWLIDNFGKEMVDLNNGYDAGGYGNSIAALEAEICDVAAVYGDARMHNPFSEGDIFALTDVIGITEPIYNDAIAISTTTVDGLLKAAIQQAMLNVSISTDYMVLMDMYSHQAYVIVQDSDYETARRIYDMIK